MYAGKRKTSPVVRNRDEWVGVWLTRVIVDRLNSPQQHFKCLLRSSLRRKFNELQHVVRVTIKRAQPLDSSKKRIYICVGEGVRIEAIA